MSENLINYTDDMFEALDESEKNSEFIAMESKTFFQDAWSKFRKNKMAVAGLIFIVIMIIGSILVPMFSHFGYEEQNISARNF